MKKLIAKLSQLFRTSAPTFQPAVVPVCRNATNHDRTGNQSYNQRNAPPHSNYRAGRKKSAQVPSTNHPRIGLVGFNLKGFAIRYCATSNDAGLVNEIADLPTQVKMVPHRDIAGGVRIALQMLSRFTQGRTGIVILTSGEPTMNSGLARELVQTAVKWRTGVNIIMVGHEKGRNSILADLATRPALGYGQFHKVMTGDELLEALRRTLHGLAPSRGMAGINSMVVLVDCSENMVESFQGTTRIEMVTAALQEYLRNPLRRATENRMALAA